MEKQTIELFSGTKSFSKVAEKKGFKTLTIDNDKKLEPNICIDILNLDVKRLPRNPFILWASPPCTSFSVASLRKYWVNSRPRISQTYIGIALVKKTLEIIEELNPTYWFIENPRGMLRHIDFMKPLHKKTVTYCQYGDQRMKPTDIWTNNINWIPKPMCSPNDPCHISSPRGSKKGTQGLNDAKERGIIPPLLIEEIINNCIKPRNIQKTITNCDIILNKFTRGAV